MDRKGCFSRLKKPFSIGFLLSFLLFFSASGQDGTIRGSIHLPGGRPVSNATVSVSGKNLSTMTDEKGRFVFRGLPGGTYDLEVSSLEIQTQVFRTTVSKSAAAIKLTVRPETGKMLEEVSVRRKTEKNEIETKGFAVNVIETKTAALQSLQTNELLDRSAGVRIRQDGGLGSHIHYNINGLSGNAVRIFIDGVPSGNFGSSFSLNSIPPALIERIEIYKGVVPGNLSEDALGGAINVVLKGQKSKNSLVASYSGGSFNTHQANMVGSFRGGNGFGAEASAFHNYSDNNYEVYGDNIAFTDHTGTMAMGQRGKRFHDAYRSSGGRMSVGYTDVAWADRFQVGGLLSRSYDEIQHGRTMIRPYGDRHTRADSRVATMGYQKQNLLAEGLSLKADASYSHLERQVIDTVGRMYDWRGRFIAYPDGTPVMYNSGAEASANKTTGINSDKTIALRAGLAYAINRRHQLHANYLYNDFKRGTKDEMLPLGLQLVANTRDLRKNILSFTYENLAFGEKLRTNVFYKHYFQKVASNEPYQIAAGPPPEYGLRVIESRRDHSGYGMAASYAMRADLYLLASAEKAMRLPSANEIFGNVADNLLPSQDGLDPETSRNANLGIGAGPYRIGPHAVKLNGSLIYRDTQGMIREGLLASANDNTRYENLEDVETHGFDAEILYSYAEKIDFNFTISKINSLFNTEFDKYGAPYRFYRSQLRNEPSFKFNANLAYHFGGLLARNSRASLHWNLNYVEGFLRNWANVGGRNLDYIPKQYANDIGAMFTLPSGKMTLSLDAKNIFDQQIFDYFGLQKPGRAFYGKVTYAVF